MNILTIIRNRSKFEKQINEYFNEKLKTSRLNHGILNKFVHFLAIYLAYGY